MIFKDDVVQFLKVKGEEVINEWFIIQEMTGVDVVSVKPMTICYARLCFLAVIDKRAIRGESENMIRKVRVNHALVRI
jgi:hypothetical protein